MPATLLVLASASVAVAHPLGNSTISHFNVLYVLPDRFELDLVLDIAETPSVSVLEEMDTNGDREDSSEERNAWLDTRAKMLAPELHVVLDGRRHMIQTVDEARDPKTGEKAGAARVITKMPGAIGMPTYQMLIRYVIKYPKPLAPGKHTLEFRDATYVNVPGLKRIILEKVPDIEFLEPHPPFWGDGPSPFIWEQYDPGNLPQETEATIRFRVPTAEKPPDHQEARVTTTPEQSSAGPTAVSPETQPAAAVAATDNTAWPEQYEEFARLDRSRQSTYQRQADRLIGLLTGRDTQGRWGITIFVLITAISFGYGSIHALMPGHAKTIVAAYLISQKGTYWHAVLLAIIVTVTHTLLVVLLGVIILVFQKTNPGIGNTLQMWLGVVSGLLVAGMGFVLVWRAMRGRLGAHPHHHHHDENLPWWRKLFTHSHPELPGHGHHHHDHDHHHHHHPHEHPHTLEYAPTKTPAADPGRELTVWTLLVLGVTGGIVPCPTATIIMLLGIGAGVVVGALYAVGVFSLGLALTLMMVGFMALSSRKAAARIMSDAQHEGELSTGSKRILLQIIPAMSGAVVIALGCAIAINYFWIMQTGNSLIKWLG